MRLKSCFQNVISGVSAVVFFFFISQSLAANLQLVSALGGSNVPSTGGNGESYLPVITPDGRYVLFASTANNLVPTNGNGPIPALSTLALNVYLRDRLAGTTTLVSVSLAANGADGSSVPMGISTNGQYALFESSADNLVTGCTNNVGNIYVRDVVNNLTTLVSVGTNGSGGNQNSYDSSITPDGRYVVFASDASNLAAKNNNGISDVFVRDLQKGATTLVSTGALYASSSLATGSTTPEITPDGRYVVFFSAATNLVPGVHTAGQVYVRDLIAGTTVFVSTNTQNLFPAGVNMFCCDPAISTNGQYVAFEVCPSNSIAYGFILQVNVPTLAATVVSTNAYMPQTASSPNFANYQYFDTLAMSPDGSSIAYVANGTARLNTAIYLWNAQAGTNLLVSADMTSGLPASGVCSTPRINSSGAYLSFISNATNLTTNALSSGSDLYLWNMQTSTLQLADVNTNGAGGGASDATVSAVSSDGSLVVFDLPPNNANLAPNDSNRGSDVFAVHPATQTSELISACLSPSLTPNNSTEIYSSCLSTNGRYVAFSSEANNLLLNDTNVCREILVRDRVLGTNILVSADTNGFPATLESCYPSISGDGRYVAFSSYASNLVAGVFSNTENVYLRDLQAGTTTLVSSNYSGGLVVSGNGDSYSPTISCNGRYVLFYSLANNLVPNQSGLTQGIPNLYLQDEQSETNYALSIKQLGIFSASMTPDGRYVAFVGATGSSPNSLCVWDSQTAALIYTNGLTGLGQVVISPDGSWIAYSIDSALWAMNLVAGTNCLIANNALNEFATSAEFAFNSNDDYLVFVDNTNIYVHNFLTGTNLLADYSFNSTAPANGTSDLPAISPDGRFVAFRSSATNIVPNATTAGENLYLYDQVNNVTTLISANEAGHSVADRESTAPEFSADGSTLLFQSYASDLASQDFNEFGAIFAASLASASTNSGGSNVVFNAQISGINQAGQNPANFNPTIYWSLMPGNAYQVQYKNNLTDPMWQNVNGNMIFIGNNGQIVDLSPSPNQRFYRIVLSN